MAKKKQQKKKRAPGAGGGVKPVRLSQCMIVKNEEKNIEKALSWAKGLAFEQIVVDTGSTDRTVEIAESLGAKVFHFEWINDFSAAKNYAIEQASGRWIAFLDADEYFPDEDAEKLMELLERFTNEPAASRAYKAIVCPIYNVDDAGKPASVARQRRIFRNLPDIRYANRIHEYLPGTADCSFETSEIGIIHTGYSESAYKETNKARRNMEMLEEEYKTDPNNANLKCYLADACYVENSPQSRERATELYAEALENAKSINSVLKHSAYLHLINYYKDQNETGKALEYCGRAIVDFPDVPDFYYHLGLLSFDREDYAQAWDALKNCEKTLNNNVETITGSAVITNPTLLFTKLAQTSQALNDNRGTVHYCVLTLREDKYQKGVLAPLLKVLTEDANTSDGDIFGLLGKLYDLRNNKDRAFILVSAKLAGNRTVFDMTRAMFSEEEIERLNIPAFEASSEDEPD